MNSRALDLTHCPYCAFQCGIHIRGERDSAQVEGASSFPVNNGLLCIKGWTAAETLNHSERLLSPLARNPRGKLVPVTWEQALKRTTAAVRRTQRKKGPDGVGVYGSGSLTNEKAYLLGKFARVALRTSNIDYNGRFCMSSAATAANKAFGLDRGLPFPLADIAHADVVLLVGGNFAETMPPITQYFDRQRENGGSLIVVDPRRTLTAHGANLHLPLTPGSDAALANGLLHLLIRDGAIDEAYIRARTEGFEDVKRVVAGYWPERVESITGISQATLTLAARMLGEARSLIVLMGRGAEQQRHGVRNTLSFINIALARGMAGRMHSGFGSLTGQGNGQGGREHGQKADQLPGYTRIDDSLARQRIARVWGIKPEHLPYAGLSAFEMLSSAGSDDGISSLLIFGSNPAVSSPDSTTILERLKALDFLAVADFFLSETAALADIVFPSAQWAEEEGTTTNLEGRVLLRRASFTPPKDVRTDIEIICALAASLDMRAHFTYASARDVYEELRRATAECPADYSGITHEKIEANDGVFWPCPSDDHPGTPRLFQNGFPTPGGRARFHAIHHGTPAEETDDYFSLYLTTGRVLGQYQTGTQTRRIEKLCEVAPAPLAEIHPLTARRHGLADGARAWLTTRRARASFQVRTSDDIREDTVFLPFHWGGAQSANLLTNPALDSASRMPEFKVCAVHVEPWDKHAGNVHD